VRFPSEDQAFAAFFVPALDDFPLSSPDGPRIVFRSTRTGLGDLYQKLTSGVGVRERLVASDQIKFPNSWSADGRFLLCNSIDPLPDREDMQNCAIILMPFFLIGKFMWITGSGRCNIPDREYPA
jgi:hypothetical protein